MFDKGRRRYYARELANKELVERLSKLSRPELVRWCDLRLREAPASELEKLLVYCIQYKSSPAAA